MKKKLVGISVLAAALTLSTGITAFAGWKQDDNGWYYQYDNGAYVGCGWFTDPADGATYYMDPDGYMMSATTVEGFKLGDDGKRIEKTEEQIQKELEQKKAYAARKTPGKAQAAADLAADAAKSGTVAVSTQRLAYQAELKVFMDAQFIATKKALINAGSTATLPDLTIDNIETSYRFNAAAGPVIESTLWKMSNPKNHAYNPNALELTYNRNYVTEAADIEKFDSLFQNMCTISLGETEGKAVADTYYAEIAAGNSSFERSGNTDTGNQYTLKYNGGKAVIYVVCSEIDPNAQAAAEENTENTAENTTEDSVAMTDLVPAEPAASKVIVAGQKSIPAAEIEDTATAVDETASTEAAAE